MTFDLWNVTQYPPWDGRRGQERAQECCCTRTWDDSAGPVGGTRRRQREWRAAVGGTKGRVYGHHVATGERHWAVRETHTLLYRPWTHHGQKQHGDLRHLKQTGRARREWEGRQFPSLFSLTNKRTGTDTPGEPSVMAGEGNNHVRTSEERTPRGSGASGFDWAGDGRPPTETIAWSVPQFPVWFWKSMTSNSCSVALNFKMCPTDAKVSFFHLKAN